MSDELVFYTNPMSRGRIARWMLEEVGAPYRTVVLDYASSMKAPEYLAVNPMGKVPAITHRGVTVTEGAAICAYLADAFPEAGLAPPVGSPERGTYYRWLMFACGPVETNKSLGFVVPEERKAMAGYGCLDDTLNALERAIEGKTYIVGDRFSAADVYVGAQIGSGMMFGSIEKRPAFEAYWAGISARPAAKRAAEIDDALIAAAKAEAGA
jgi:glutathione S-transferase